MYYIHRSINCPVSILTQHLYGAFDAHAVVLPRQMMTAQGKAQHRSKMAAICHMFGIGCRVIDPPADNRFWEGGGVRAAYGRQLIAKIVARQNSLQWRQRQQEKCISCTYSVQCTVYSVHWYSTLQRTLVDKNCDLMGHLQVRYSKFFYVQVRQHMIVHFFHFWSTLNTLSIVIIQRKQERKKKRISARREGNFKTQNVES